MDNFALEQKDDGGSMTTIRGLYTLSGKTDGTLDVRVFFRSVAPPDADGSEEEWVALSALNKYDPTEEEEPQCQIQVPADYQGASNQAKRN